MSTNVLAADLGGIQGLYRPPHLTDIVINEIHQCSSLMGFVNQAWTAESLGLNCAPSAHYHLIGNIEPQVFTRHQYNGESVGLPNPVRNGELTMCQNYEIKEKFSRAQAARYCKQWEMMQDGYEKVIAAMLRDMNEEYGYRMIVAMAAEYNQGMQAGFRTGGIKLGDSTTPLEYVRKEDDVSDTKVTAVEVVRRLDLALSEAGVTCGSPNLKLRASQGFVSRLRAEQSALGAGGSCCLEKNPAIDGMVLPVYGTEVQSSPFIPTKRLADGRLVEYVLLGDPEMIAAPSVLQYLEWEKLLNDIYLIGSYDFDVSVLSGRSVAVAAIVL